MGRRWIPLTQLRLALAILLPGLTYGGATSEDFDGMQKVLSYPQSQIYAAMIQTVGSSLTLAVKEGCLVNWKYADMDWSATCHSRSQGKTTVILEFKDRHRKSEDPEMERIEVVGVELLRQEQARLFWKKLKEQLRHQ
jgi:hypothetical protein